jgi:hypothetical protein
MYRQKLPLNSSYHTHMKKILTLAIYEIHHQILDEERTIGSEEMYIPALCYREQTLQN